MRRWLLLGLLLLLPTLGEAAIVWTCGTPKVTALDIGYLSVVSCTSDTGTYVTAGGCLGVGCAATQASAGAVVCGSSARIPVFVASTSASPVGGTTMNPTIYDASAFKLRVFESAATGLNLLEKTSAEAITASSVVTLFALCQ